MWRLLSLGNQILIYENGQTYYIDSDLIYTPWFVAGTLRSVDIVKTDTVSKEDNKNENGISMDFEK